ncbi:MAG: nucleotidyltransferase family protein [Chloroflexota bacterium]|nr:nucleotidyltransferase family protein [Chloroflexota bacterium]
MLSEHRIGILILAAGRGTRMGKQPKLLLPLSDGTPLIRHACISALSLAPCELLVVVRPDLPALADAISDLPLCVVPNPDYRQGMASSLTVGINAVAASTDAVLLMLGDEPQVPAYIVQRVLAGYLLKHKPVTIPMYGSQVGPPAILSRALFPALRALIGDAGVRQLVTRDPGVAHLVHFKESERPQDIDTPQDYSGFLQRASDYKPG